MTGFLAFIASLALLVAVFELASRKESNRLLAQGGQADRSLRSTWQAFLVALLPGQFDPAKNRRSQDVIDLIRRAGYPYDSPAAFYIAAVRYFTLYLFVGAAAAAIFYLLGAKVLAPVAGGFFVFLGLNRPYSYLKSLAKKRAEATKRNMLVGLSTLEALLSSGMGLQDSLRAASDIGGPFCNLMRLLVARLEIEPADNAIETVLAHAPDPNDAEMRIFLQDVLDHYQTSRPILPGVSALRASVHRTLLEETEARSALILQRTSLFGIFAVVGLVLSIVLPFL